jgi:hypothetical protein
MAEGLRANIEGRALFLAALAQGHTVTAAARTAAVPRSTAYAWRESDPEFAKQWEDAYNAGTEAFEQEARRRAIEGIERGVYYQGERVDTQREYSDTLMMFMLKARAPEKYRERLDVKHDVGGIAERILAARQRAGVTIDAQPVRPALPAPIDPDDPILG